MARDSSKSRRGAVSKRRRPHELPEFPPDSYTYPESSQNGHGKTAPDIATLRAIAEKHGFPPEIDLAEKLDERWFWWRFDVVTGRHPSASVQRKFLREVTRRVASLGQALDRVPEFLRRSILECAGGSERLDVSSLRQALHVLRSASFAATERVQPSHPGAWGNPELIDLLMKLHRIWQEAFGANAARIGKADRYRGKFFDFANDVLKVFGIQKSNQALGKAIELAIGKQHKRVRVSKR